MVELGKQSESSEKQTDRELLMGNVEEESEDDESDSHDSSVNKGSLAHEDMHDMIHCIRRFLIWFNRQ